MVVTRVEALLLRQELREPVRLGRHTISSRDVVAVRVDTDTGCSGFALGASRGTPVLEAVRALASYLVGRDALAREALIERCTAPFAFGRAAIARGLGLLDIALWDVAARVACVPLHLLLGGARWRAPAMQVCGYGLEANGEEHVIDELRHFEALGLRRLKVMLPAGDVRWTVDFLARCRDAIGPSVSLGVDFMYSLEPLGVREIERLCRALDDVGLAFIEDPLDSAYWRQYAALAPKFATPLTTGEDVAHPAQYLDLLNALHVVRVDPLVSDGITGAVKAIALAASGGAKVLPHGHHALNAALAGAFPAVECVEVAAARDIRDGEAVSPDSNLRLDGGDVVLDEAPGNGLRLDWDRLVADAVARWSTHDRGTV